MKIKDRFLIVRRSLLIAINPKTQGVYLKTIQKNGVIEGNLIFTNKSKADELFESDLVDMFVNRNKPTSSLLRKRVIGLCLLIESYWNNKNPQHQVELVNKG